MTKIKLAKLSETKKTWLDIIIDRIGEGRVLPCISNRFINDLIFPSHEALVETWMDYIEFPGNSTSTATFPTGGIDFNATLQYQSVTGKAETRGDYRYIKKLYLEFVQKVLFEIADKALLEDLHSDLNWQDLPFSQLAQRLSRPSFEEGIDNPLLLLAALPLPIYLTTSYHNLMEIALEKARKKPRSEICYWNDNLASIDSVLKQDRDYIPNKDEPLVYHLHGMDAHPDSLVLTEDDHLDFLVAISQNFNLIPNIVREALSSSSLILLGYDLASWDFRVLFRGLVKTVEEKLRPKSVSIQIETDVKEWKNYMVNYLEQEADFEVYWGDTLSFIKKLHEGWKA